MKRLIAVALAVALTGCGSLLKNEVRIGSGKGPSFETVVDFLRLGDEDGARDWLVEKKGVSRADAEELIVRAKIQLVRAMAKCAGKALCQIGIQPSTETRGAATAAEAAEPPKER